MSYTERLVETILPSVWDRTFAWGIQNDLQADPDMPKAKYKSPKEATTFWTQLIDIRIAWEHAPLTMPERRALLLAHGFGWTSEEIAVNQQVTPRAINKRLAKGVDTLTRWLNADAYVQVKAEVENQ